MTCKLIYAHHSSDREIWADSLVFPVLLDILESPYAGRDEITRFVVVKFLLRQPSF